MTAETDEALNILAREFDRITAIGGTPSVRVLDAADALMRASEAIKGSTGGGLSASAGPRGTGALIPAMAAANGRAQPSPEQREDGGSASITASVTSGTAAAGATLADEDELARHVGEVLSRAQHDGSRERIRVASVSWQYPEERRLGTDPVENGRKLDAVTGLRSPRFDRSTGALVATGGICLPVNVDYSVPTWSTADRPLRAGLPSFQASRGGVRFVTPPDIGVPTLQGGTASGAGESVEVWTEATDANPAGATKPVWVVECGSEQLVYVSAIPTRVQFGNMESMFAPEQVAANTQQAISISARDAELYLLTQMYNASKQVTPAQYLGATRDLLSSIDLLAAQYRYSHRVPETAAMTAVLPAWAKALIRADLTRELAHDNTNGRDSLAISDAQIEEWFAVRGVNAIWTIDGLQAGTYGSGGSALKNQFFPIATAGAEPQWPNQDDDGTIQVGWLLYVEGTYQHLDGGQLDLGVVRDSLLDSTNDYETFVEVFENVAFRGLEAYQVQSTLIPTGYSGGTVGTGYAE